MSAITVNPLLSSSWLPHFQAIQVEHIKPAVRQILRENQEQLNQLVEHPLAYTWADIMLPLEELSDRLAYAWSPVSHLHGVMQSDALRDAYNTCLPLITEYHTLLMQNKALFHVIEELAKDVNFKRLDKAQKKAIENELRDFRLSGVHLPPNQKTTFLELEKKLSQLTTQFSENLLDATQGWFFHLTDKAKLAGLPNSACELAEKSAKQRNLDGWILTLDYPSYSAVMKFLDDRNIRKTLYEAYSTRASDQGPCAGKWDNSQIMNDILVCRLQSAQLLDFKNYADYALVPKMAKNSEMVMNFLLELLNKVKPFAEKEMTELKEFISSIQGPDDIAPWDLSYYSEKLRQSKFNFSEEDIKPYFPITKVLPGLFSLVNKIFGLSIKERQNIETWHPDVRFFEIYDTKNEFRGGLYIDLYARQNKREGAWMDDCRQRRRLRDHSIQQPVAYLTCNFTPPLNHTPALLNHDEVLTLFHELGHCLHHILTKIDYSSVSGLHGVPWDAVEFPSQFMELWFWEQEILNMISGHHQTEQPLPAKLYKQLIAAKNFQSGLQMLRQLEFALFDFRLHMEYDSQQHHQIQKILDEVRQKTALIEVPRFNRFQHSFAHIFAGGYAAGYYSYAWADVLSCDAYSTFGEKGHVLDRTTGESFMKNILEQGGACDPLEAFIAFRGRKPEMDALFRQNGWII